MGASAWSYFVPYQRDVSSALEALRWKVFREGAYVKTSRVLLDFDEFTAHDFGILEDEHSRGIWEAWHAEVIEELQEHVGSPDALRLHNGSEGTHSIIDITRANQLHALSPDLIKQLFGTETPTREDIAKIDTLVTAVGRNHCTYVTVYEGNQPTELFFFGFSGD